jgi:phosphoglucomutase
VEGLLQDAQRGFQAVQLDDKLKDAALSNLQEWLCDERFALYRPAIVSLIEDGRYKLLVDSFYRMLPFGTGGRRGAVGVGPNRINPYTVTTSVQGHSQFLKLRFPEASLHVVLAADVRCFADMKELYRPGTLGPLEGMTSRSLCQMAAQVYAANGIRVVMADPRENTYVSTPELSFLIYDLQAHGGLNISASHNPPDDNGAKFYNAAGGQEVPPHDEELVKIASQVREALTTGFNEAVDQGLIHFLTREQRMSYIDANLSISLDRSARSAKVAFSSLHGTGITTAAPVLERAGFSVAIVRSQETFDGAFPAVPHHVPNPEVPSAMEAVIDVARREGCDVAMATDPDADRLGVAVPDNAGDWQCLTGNQIGILMAYHILETRKQAGLLLPSNYVIKTEVTTNLVANIAEAYGVRCIGHLLVGFKYIGDVLDQIDRTGRWNGEFQARSTDFLLAVEESHGVLATEVIRDKDAANGALLIAELASICKDQGSSLYQQLQSIYKKYGYFGTGLKSVVMEGAAGLANIAAIQKRLRESPPTHIAGIKVLEFHDRQDEKGTFGPIKSQTDRESRNVLVFVLEGGARLVLRPSGTEPKNKSYLELAASPVGSDAGDDKLPAQIDEVNRKLDEILTGWVVEMLACIGTRLPPYATRFADSVPLSRKLLFVNVIDPEIRHIVVSRVDPRIAVERVQKLLLRIASLDLLRGGLKAMGEGLDRTDREYWDEVVNRLE